MIAAHSSPALRPESGANLRDNYPEGALPYVSGEAVNTAWTYGYDAVTMMQETKVSLCQIARA